MFRNIYVYLVFFFIGLNASEPPMKYPHLEIPFKIYFQPQMLVALVAEKIVATCSNLDFLKQIPAELALFVANTKNKSGNTLLHREAYLGNFDTVKYLLELGVTKRVYNKWDETPLLVSAKAGHIHICNLLFTLADAFEDFDCLEKYIMAIDSKDALCFGGEKLQSQCSEELVYYAMKGGSLPWIQETLENCSNGICLNKNDYHKGLFNAIKSGCCNHVALIFYYAKKDGFTIFNDVDNKNFLYEATKYGYIDIVHLLIQEGACITPEELCCAIRENNSKLVELYVKKISDINQKDSNQNTPLFYARLYQHKGIEDLLISLGAEDYSEDSEGEEF